MGAFLFSFGEPASVFQKRYTFSDRSKLTGQFKSSLSVLTTRGDTRADYFTVRKTEEIIVNVWPQGVLCSSFGRSLGARIVMFEVMEGVKIRVFFCQGFWRATFRGFGRGRKRLGVNCHFSDGSCVCFEEVP